MKLTHNLGWLDKLMRYGLSAIFISLHLTGTVTGTTGLILLALAGILLATGIFRFCPIYYVFGLKTCNPREKHMGKYE